jgi:GNAT superfamily N-acetyltransferase
MIRIRKAQSDDIELIARFNTNLAKETEDFDLDQSLILNGVTAIFDDPSKGQYFIAEIEGNIVGQTAVTTEWSDWRNGYWWWIQSVYITHEARKCGVFRALYDHIKQEAQKAGAVGLRLYVDQSNTAAQQTYCNLGMDKSHYLFFETEFPK